ncbi:MAG: 3-deoxy-manno-octulosonate cytidylyltransferase [Burkholderiales bacterium]|jgi:3-deoxy-manno-octulosonate cytidylyltransferase (CMP-KDO synthetase)|nr:3-deoxy-manno-octulosonate cytidylyltransferase [Burkholderiales bacterium]
MPFTVILPARYSSTRLPGKPLADLGGVPMIVRAATQAQKSQALRVVVATDDKRIRTVTEDAGIETVMTRDDHTTGTDRIAEAARLLGIADDEIVVNVQGDEPFIPPKLIDEVGLRLQDRGNADIATACHPITREEDAYNPNVVKVVLNRAGDALYFSRATIPAVRDLEKNVGAWLNAYPPEHRLYRHYGIYAYRASFLKIFPALPISPIETLEKLEQLRALWYGYTITVCVTDEAPAGIDTPEDLRRAAEIAQKLVVSG